jgi:hypothetical protein
LSADSFTVRRCAKSTGPEDKTGDGGKRDEDAPCPSYMLP